MSTTLEVRGQAITSFWICPSCGVKIYPPQARGAHEEWHLRAERYVKHWDKDRTLVRLSGHPERAMSHKLRTARDRVEPEIFTRGQRLDTEPLTTSSGHSERCQNPVCSTPLEPLEDGWRRTQRRFCSDGCKMNAWAIRRVRKLLENETDERALEILRGKP